MRYIGDVHGKWAMYKNIANQVPASVQIGDFGVGFSGEDYKKSPMLDANHRFIRGNHDNPGECKRHPNWIADGTVEDDIMYVGGAWSIDHQGRRPGVSWWEDEELSMAEFYEVIDKYGDIKPRMMITHDCPVTIAKQFMVGNGEMFPSKTGQAFDQMFEIHKPEVWIFGHWHQGKDFTCLGTRFICLNELSYIDL